MKRILIAALLFTAALACKKRDEAPVEPPPAPKPAVMQTKADDSQKKLATPQPSVTLAAGAPIPANGVALWLQGDDARAGKVAAWANPLVANVTATAASAAEQPEAVAGALNGHTVIRFDGDKNMLMTNIDISPARMPEATIIAVFSSKADAPTPLRKLYGDDNGAYDRAAGIDNRAEGKNYTLFTGKGVEGDFQLEKEKPYLTVDQLGAKDVSTWVNGHATLARVETDYGEALPNMYIGGTGTSYHEPWMGDVAEIIVYARALTDQERTQVEDYLAHKYALTLQRP